MTPEQLAARWLADVERFDVQTTIGGDNATAVYLADAIAAIARHLAPGDDLVERANAVLIDLQTHDSVDDTISEAADTIIALVARLFAMKASNATLRDRLARMEGALQDIAKQKKTTEMETEYDVECADFEGGYDTCIDVSRAALTDGGSNG